MEEKDLKERVTEARNRYEELYSYWLNGSLLPRHVQEMEWLDRNIQLIQAEAMVRSAYRAWM